MLTLIGQRQTPEERTPPKKALYSAPARCRAHQSEPLTARRPMSRAAWEAHLHRTDEVDKEPAAHRSSSNELTRARRSPPFSFLFFIKFSIRSIIRLTTVGRHSRPHRRPNRSSKRHRSALLIARHPMSSRRSRPNLEELTAPSPSQFIARRGGVPGRLENDRVVGWKQGLRAPV